VGPDDRTIASTAGGGGVFLLVMAVPKLRLDELLVARGLAESRAQAKAIVMSGRVLHGTVRLDKPGKDYPADLELTV